LALARWPDGQGDVFHRTEIDRTVLAAHHFQKGQAIIVSRAGYPDQPAVGGQLLQDDVGVNKAGTTQSLGHDRELSAVAAEVLGQQVGHRAWPSSVVPMPFDDVAQEGGEGLDEVGV
jgi:hypothetical protein